MNRVSTSSLVRSLAAASLAACLWQPAGAAVIHDESVNGDLADDGVAPFTTPLGALPVGTSSVIGSMVYGFGSGPTDSDNFTFVVAPGTVLVSINLGYTVSGLAPLQGAAEALYSQRFLLFRDGTPGFLPGGDQTLNVSTTTGAAPVSGSAWFGGAMSLGAGTYEISDSSSSFQDQSAQNVTLSYTWDLTVRPLDQQVPLPGTLALLGLGMVTAAWRGSKAKRAV